MGQPEEKKKDPKWKKILKVIYMLAMIVYTVYSFIMALLAFLKFKDITNTFGSQLENWKAAPFEDIKAIPGTESCPSGYTDIYKYEWPGTIVGCDCREIFSNPGDKLEKTLYRGVCNETMQQAQCDEIPSSPSKVMTIFNNKKLCGKVLSGVDFFKYGDKLDKEGKCKDGFKKCGGKSDPALTFCIPNDMPKCPVMDLANSKVNDNYIDIGQGFFISTNPDTDRAPISQIFINEGVACRNHIGETTTTEKKVNIELMNKKLKVCNTNDGNYTHIGGEMTRKALFEQNNYNLSQARGLEASFSDSQKIKNFKRGYEGFEPKCREDLLKVKDTEDEVNKIKTSQTFLLVFTVIITAVIGILFNLIDLCLLCECAEDPKTSKLYKCKKIQTCIDITLKLIEIGLCLWAVLLSAKIKSFYHDLGAKNCGDEGLNSNLEKLSDQISNFVFKNNRNALITSVIALVITVIMLLYGAFCSKKKKDESQINPQESEDNGSHQENQENEPMKQSLQMPDARMPEAPLAGGPTPGMGGPSPGFNPYPTRGQVPFGFPQQ